MKQPVPCRGPVGLTRRNLLQIAAIGALHLSLPQMLAAREARARKGPAARADACILIFLNGGPSHLDTFDMKPAAPAEVRGEFRPVASSLSGVPVCEHLPKLARQMHRCTLVRSVQHSVNNAHAAAVYAAL